MRAEVDEVATARDLRNHPPPTLVSLTYWRGLLVADADRSELTDPTTAQQFFDRGKARHGATVVGHKQTHPRLVAGRNHLLTLQCRASHRLLDIDGFACLRDTNHILPM